MELSRKPFQIIDGRPDYPIMHFPVTDSLSDLEIQVQFNPKSIDSKNLLSTAYLSNNQLIKAFNEIQSALILNINNPIANFNLGCYHLLSNNSDEAEEHFLIAINNNKHLYLAAFNLGTIYYNRGELEKALEFFEITLKKERLCYQARHFIGDIAYSRGKYKNALNSYFEVLRINPENEKTLFNIAKTYEKMEQFERAIGYYIKALEINPDKHQIYNNLGIIKLKHKEFEEAKFYFQKALRINPVYELAKRNLDDLLEKQPELRTKLTKITRKMNIKQFEIYLNDNNPLNSLSALYKIRKNPEITELVLERINIEKNKNKILRLLKITNIMRIDEVIPKLSRYIKFKKYSNLHEVSLLTLGKLGKDAIPILLDFIVEKEGNARNLALIALSNILDETEDVEDYNKRIRSVLRDIIYTDNEMENIQLASDILHDNKEDVARLTLVKRMELEEDQHKKNVIKSFVNNPELMKTKSYMSLRNELWILFLKLTNDYCSVMDGKELTNCIKDREKTLENFGVTFFEQIKDLKLMDKKLLEDGRKLQLILANKIKASSLLSDHMKNQLLVDYINFDSEIDSVELNKFKDKVKANCQHCNTGFLISFNGFSNHAINTIEDYDGLIIGLIDKHDFLNYFKQELDPVTFLDMIVVQTSQKLVKVKSIYSSITA